MAGIRFRVVSDGHLRQFATCETCGAVLTPDEGEALIDAIEAHSQWHYAMNAAIADVREELREHGIEP